MPSNGTSKITLTLAGEGKGRGEIFIIQITRTEQSHGVKEDFNLPFFGTKVRLTQCFPPLASNPWDDISQLTIPTTTTLLYFLNIKPDLNCVTLPCFVLDTIMLKN